MVMMMTVMMMMMVMMVMMMDDDVHDGDDGEDEEDEEDDDDEEEDEELARLILTSQFGRIHLLHCILRFSDFHVALHAVMSVSLVFYIKRAVRYWL